MVDPEVVRRTLDRTQATQLVVDHGFEWRKVNLDRFPSAIQTRAPPTTTPLPATPTALPTPSALPTAPPAASPAPVATTTPLNPNFAVVPNLGGLSEADAQRLINQAKLATTYTNYQTINDVPDKSFFNSIPPGHVLSQLPQAGSTVPRGSKVYIAVRKP